MSSTQHDFDFLLGRWQVHNRKLQERLADCDDWETFTAKLDVRSILNGLGNVDEFAAVDSDFKGTTLRLFNPETGLWSLYWMDSNHPYLFPPLVGSFSAEIGTFFAEEEFKGEPILVRFLWTDITAGYGHWAQAFSTDDGETWETNWTMAFTRES